MASSTFRFTLDMHSVQSQISVPVLFGDTGIIFRIIFADGSNPYIIKDGCLAKLTIKRPTGTRLEKFCTIENNTTIVYEFSENPDTAVVVGIHECEITLYDLDGKNITSPRFTMVVHERVLTATDVDYTDEDFTAVDAMMKEEAQRQLNEAGRINAEAERKKAEGERVAAVREYSEKAKQYAELAATYVPKDGNSVFVCRTMYEHEKGLAFVMGDGTKPPDRKWQVGDIIIDEFDAYFSRITHIEGGVPYIESLGFTTKGVPGERGDPGPSTTITNITESTADGGSNVVTFSDGKSVTIKNGKDGVDATPVTPLFVNKIEECTDTTKPYVLPDGYIYGRILTEKVVGGCTNLAEPLPDNTTDTTKWVNDYRFSSSGLTTSEGKGKTVCNPISVAKGDVIRVKGVDFVANVDRFELSGKNSSGETATQRAYISVLPNVMLDYELVDGVHTFTVVYANIATDGSIRFVFSTPADASTVIITVNEEITEPQIVKEYAWGNTGHAFVPADYEGRILALEDDSDEQAESIAALTERITDIENNAETEADTGIPTHWQNAIEAAKTKIANIQSNGGVNCVGFVWTSDIHASAGIDEKGKRFGIVAKAIMDEADIPLFVGTGDLMSQSSHSSVTNVYNELALARKWLEPIPYERQALIMGNHDGAWGDTFSGYYYKQLPLEVVYNLIYRKQAMDFRRVSGENGTYYYIDNVSQKVRFIMLNTNNTPSDENYDNADGTAKYDRFHKSCYGETQLKWLSDVALDMPEGYTACIFGHEPYPGDYIQLVGIVDAYNNKKNFSNTFTDSDNTWRNSTISVNFSNAKGEIAGVFAGHTHLSEMRYTGNNPMYTTCPLITIANAVGGEVRDGTTRTDGTDSEFAMDIVTVDTKNRKIHMTRLGAGSDREVGY